MSLAGKLKKWSDNNLITAEQGNAILAFEKKKGHTHLFYGLGGLGVLSIILGIASLIAANWYRIPPEVRIGGHVLCNLLVAGLIIFKFNKTGWTREILVTLKAGLVLTFIALIGQILQTQAPLWQPLGLWLLLVTPMLLIYTRFIGVILIWIGVLAFTVISTAIDVADSTTTLVIASGLPFALLLTFMLTKIKTALAPWSKAVLASFALTTAIVTSIAQLGWRFPLIEIFVPEALITITLGTTLCLLLTFLARIKAITFFAKAPYEMTFMLLLSYLFTIPPLLFLHPSLPTLGAFLFCLYWLLIGITGLRLGAEKIWSLAMVLIGVRIFVAYIEIMGTLATQGIGFILSGFIFIILALITRKLIQKKPKWLTPQTDKGEA